MDELKSQKENLAVKRKTLQAKKKAAPSHVESAERTEITLDMLGDVSARFQRAMAKADFATREKLVNRLVSSVTLHANKATVKGNIPVIRGDALIPSNLASGFFTSQNLSTPAPARVTQTVGLPVNVAKLAKNNRKHYENYEDNLRMSENKWEALEEVMQNERAAHKNIVIKLVSKLEDKIDFKLKALKASIQFTANGAFSVIGFRRNGNNLFIEFYSDEKIVNERIEETHKRGDWIINRILIDKVDDIDNELVRWVVDSYKLTNQVV